MDGCTDNLSNSGVKITHRNKRPKAIQDDQSQFKNLAGKDYYSLLRIAQKNNLNMVGTGAKGRLLRKDFIDAIKAFTSPETFREADLREIRRFQDNFGNGELQPRLFNDNSVQFYHTHEQ